ncbi:MAG: hypothetical protein U0169_04655 [Polyangiaceae bacterium]
MRTPTRLALLLGSLASAATLSVACSSADVEGQSDPTVTDDAAEALTTAEAARPLFDVNDVSILFPLDKKGLPEPALTLDDTDKAGAPLLAKDAFDQVIAFAKTTPRVDFGAEEDKRANWRIVGMRFDPCAPTTKIAGDPVLAAVGISECILQVRLIAQPFVSGSDQDFTAHLVYNFGTKSSLEKAGAGTFDAVTGRIVGQLRAIRDESAKVAGPTVGRTLGVHPGLKKDPKKIGALVKDFIAETVALSTKAEAASGQSTKSVAFMGLENGGPEPWAFFAGRIMPTKGWQPLPMPAFPKAKTVSQKLSFLDAQQVLPKSELPVSTLDLFALPLSKPEAAKIAFAVEQPDSTHFFNMDCVSCHTSSSRILTLGLKSTAERFAVPAGITGYTTRDQAQGSTWNVRNFGYFGGKPTVSYRTTNETVEVVKFMNTEWIPERANLRKLNDRRLAQKKPELFGPARDCTKEDAKVFDCFAQVEGDDDAVQGAGKCMQKCGGLATQSTDTEPDEGDPTDPIRPPPSGDPCAEVPSENPEVTTEGSVVILRESNAKCLSRQLNGSFESAAAAVVCTSSRKCTITLKKPVVSGKTSKVTLDGRLARRLASTLMAPEDVTDSKRSFVSKGPDARGNQLSIKCDAKGKECTIAIRSK